MSRKSPILLKNFPRSSGQNRSHPHGIPDLPFTIPVSSRMALERRKNVLLTFGLASLQTRHRNVIQRCRQSVCGTRVVYMISGVTAPAVLRREVKYRCLAEPGGRILGSRTSWIFRNRFRHPRELVELIAEQHLHHALQDKVTSRFRERLPMP